MVWATKKKRTLAITLNCILNWWIWEPFFSSTYTFFFSPECRSLFNRLLTKITWNIWQRSQNWRGCWVFNLRTYHHFPFRIALELYLKKFFSYPQWNETHLNFDKRLWHIWGSQPSVIFLGSIHTDQWHNVYLPFGICRNLDNWKYIIPYPKQYYWSTSATPVKMDDWNLLRCFCI